MTMTDDPYFELAAAIIKMAIKDYEAAYRHYLKHPDSASAKDRVRQEKRFFYSQWFELLSDLDGPRLVSLVEAQVKEKMKGGAT